MKFVVGCDLEEFKRYYRTLEGLRDYLKLILKNIEREHPEIRRTEKS